MTKLQVNAIITGILVVCLEALYMCLRAFTDVEFEEYEVIMLKLGQAGLLVMAHMFAQSKGNGNGNGEGNGHGPKLPYIRRRRRRVIDEDG